MWPESFASGSASGFKQTFIFIPGTYKVAFFFSFWPVHGNTWNSGIFCYADNNLPQKTLQ
jgi:hypothetical protein